MNFALTLSSALLLILIFPRFGWTWLAPVALAPLLVACAREGSWKKRFVHGWIAGAVFWGSVCYWIQFVLEVHGGMGRWGGWGSFLLYALYKGLHLGAFAALAGFLMPRTWALPAVAALWVGIERTHGPMLFAWLDLGNAGIDMPLLLRLAPFTGVYGLSFVFALLACAVAFVALRRPRVQLASLAVLPGLFALPALPPASAGTESALVVQPNVDTEMQWTERSLADVEQHMALLSRASGASLLVWPEVPAPFYPNNAAFHEYLTRIVRNSQARLLLGGMARTAQGDLLNSAFLVNSTGEIVDRYDKVNLVPFGEYVPPAFGWVNRITHEAGDFVPGNRVVIFPFDGHKLGAFICYESVFPHFVREFTRQGAEVLMNLSNDGYFGGGAGREQHLSLVRMRAAENHRWILRATNDGITAMIDPAGRVTQTLPGFEQTSATMRYSYRTDVTPYVRYGDWFAWGCLLVGLVSCAIPRRYARKPI